MKKLIIYLVLFMAILPSFSNNGILDKVFNIPIEKLQKNPEEYHNKEIKIKGTVIKSASFLMQTGFIIKDDTGEIFVVSNKMPPKINNVVSLKGKIIIVGNINDKNFIYFKENKDE